MNLRVQRNTTARHFLSVVSWVLRFAQNRTCTCWARCRCCQTLWYSYDMVRELSVCALVKFMFNHVCFMIMVVVVEVTMVAVVIVAGCRRRRCRRRRSPVLDLPCMIARDCTLSLSARSCRPWTQRSLGQRWSALIDCKICLWSWRQCDCRFQRKKEHTAQPPKCRPQKAKHCSCNVLVFCVFVLKPCVYSLEQCVKSCVLYWNILNIFEFIAQTCQSTPSDSEAANARRHPNC